jgi:hypothetical protein
MRHWIIVTLLCAVILTGILAYLPNAIDATLTVVGLR